MPLNDDQAITTAKTQRYATRLMLVFDRPLSEGATTVARLPDFHGYRVRIVDGAAIRRGRQDYDEFGNWAIHDDFPDLIPNNEIWISDESEPDEHTFLVTAAAVRLDDLAAGKSASAAYEHAIRKERALRVRAHNVRYDPLASGAGAAGDDAVGVRLGTYVRIAVENLTVYLVDGDVVRDKYKTDFVDGGNGGVYHFVPNDEIWIEHTLEETERITTTVHEFVELMLMTKRHENYDAAHGLAAMVDWPLHQRLDLVDLTKLDAAWALKMVDYFSQSGGKWRTTTPKDPI